MFKFIRNLICSGATSGATSGSTSGSAPATSAIIPALDILWKGMLGIFVVSALIFITVKILNKINSKK